MYVCYVGSRRMETFSRENEELRGRNKGELFSKYSQINTTDGLPKYFIVRYARYLTPERA